MSGDEIRTGTVPANRDVLAPAAEVRDRPPPVASPGGPVQGPGGPAGRVVGEYAQGRTAVEFASVEEAQQDAAAARRELSEVVQKLVEKADVGRQVRRNVAESSQTIIAGAGAGAGIAALAIAVFVILRRRRP